MNKERKLVGDEIKIELWDQHDLCGVIFPEMSGVHWTNQCGGTACAHPSLEGIYVPVGVGRDPREDKILYDYYGAGYDAELVQEFLDWLLVKWLEPIPEGRGEELFVDNLVSGPVLPLYEAWVPVLVNDEVKDITSHAPKTMELFAGKIGVFTYYNSD